MSAETEILAEVEALKAKFSDTKTLYREVCVLLFFRYGITPTANKLYQYVRRGSMNVPAEEVGKFWDDLRHRARVDIQHPDLPEPIKAVAAEAIAALWSQATEAARGELAAARLELQADAERAQQAQAAAEQALAEAQAKTEEIRGQVVQMQEWLQQAQTALEAERRAHAGTQARVQQMLSQLEDAGRQQQALQDGFAAELAKARDAVEAANDRAAGAERRALKEIEQERQARGRADNAAEATRQKLAQVEAAAREQAVEHAAKATRLEIDANQAKLALDNAVKAQAGQEAQVAELRRQLTDSQQATSRYEAEAKTLQALVERLAPVPAPDTSTPARQGRRKVGSSGT
ncbi:DNA-binding protein [Pelomonas sp. P7]|uniref:DNA-binding protein n=1 Tax=Pelomonas caseinilytica TaxID=2906763 RepID=A0ABS8XU55_9BURK|nr:DNA-binding protein [Pelomonas sp. P7]MCE4540750.1 DNA-binding protein [Pelomonas sp. P7]